MTEEEARDGRALLHELWMPLAEHNQRHCDRVGVGSLLECAGEPKSRFVAAYELWRESQAKEKTQ